MTSGSEPGAWGILPNSIAPSSACSLAFSSVTNIQARSFAVLLFACGLMSAFAAGNALSTLIVVGNSRSSTPKNCSISVIAPPQVGEARVPVGAPAVRREIKPAVSEPSHPLREQGGQFLEATVPTVLVPRPRLGVGKPLVREHDLRAPRPVVELDGHERLGRPGRRLPLPGIDQAVWGIDLTVGTRDAMQRAVRCPHVDAIAAAHPQVHFCDGSCEISRRAPALQVLRPGPRLEDFFPRRLERALEPNGDRGGLRSGGHGESSSDGAFGSSR